MKNVAIIESVINGWLKQPFLLTALEPGQTSRNARTLDSILAYSL